MTSSEENILSANASNDASDDDDAEDYYIRCFSETYDVREKLEAANKELYNENELDARVRTVRVKFKENLVEYEPDYSDEEEEIRSNISDNSAVESTKISLNLCNLESEDELQEEEEELSESLLMKLYSNNTENIGEELEGAEVLTPDSLEGDKARMEELPETSPIIQTKKLSVPNSKTGYRSRKKPDPPAVFCKTQCLESLDDLSIKGIALLSGFFRSEIPVLKLKPRICCDARAQKLPIYKGLNSEYGLTEDQLKHRKEHREFLEERKREMRKLKEEELQKKNEQNEKVFCEWLQSVYTRNRRNIQFNRSFLVKPPPMGAVKERPKTAGLKPPINNTATRRPRTSLGLSLEMSSRLTPTCLTRQHITLACVNENCACHKNSRKRLTQKI